MHLPAGLVSSPPQPCFHHANVSPRGYGGLERASVGGGAGRARRWLPPIGGSPPRWGGTSCGPDIVSVNTVCKNPVVTQHGVDTHQRGLALRSKQLPGSERGSRCKNVVELNGVCLEDWDRGEG